MNLYCIKCLIFAKSNNIKIKREIIGKIIFYFCCNDCGFKKFVTIDKVEVKDLLI